ncbi:ATP-binding protein [Micromonospora sp. BQ11]|uniref:ATP-binding protein n=1 Tax=Micromonospora sp. BQ11 TaxID=3452212 RepID=UPI003F88AEC4
MSAHRGHGAPLTARIDDLQRPGPADAATWTGPGTVARSVALLRVTRVGSRRKAKEQTLDQSSDPAADRRGLFELLVGLQSRRMPVALAIGSDGRDLSVQVGSWSTRPQLDVNDQRSRGNVVAGLLRASYPTVVHETGPGLLSGLTRGGYVLGTPAASDVAPAGKTGTPPRRTRPDDHLSPLDRLSVGMAGHRWLALVLAQPAADEQRINARNDTLAEQRSVAEIVANDDAVRPLAEHYTDLLSAHLGALAGAASTGVWRVGVYLLGTPESYPLLTALWQGHFSGQDNEPHSVTVFEDPQAVQAAYRWSLPDALGRAGPSALHRPWAAQSLLSSVELARYVSLPTQEAPGFAIDTVADFDSVLTRPTGPALSIGAVLHRGLPGNDEYRVAVSQLTRHCFVAGVTGAGKTNTVFQLLRQIHTAGIPFLVLEPAKTEYRALLGDPTFRGDLRVYTPGIESVAPLRFNPFELGPGTNVSAHIDLMRSVFTSSFAMWAPLPQVFERCLVEVYADRGWDLGSGRNVRDGGDPDSVPAPTLGDLASKVTEVVPTLGYKPESRDEIQAALLTRINSLRSGARGRMLDVQRSTPLTDLLAGPTVLELEGLGDDDDKAFVMGSLLVHLYEHRRQQALTDDVRHLIVVEEAHRLLTAAPPQTDAYTANPKGKFVEAFSQMLSEMRAYGQGFLIADQVPVRLAPDVVKNTELKIIHRLVARDDREAVAGAMAMTKAQATALTTLDRGDAAVFSAGDDAPVLVHVPKRKGQGDLPMPGGQQVASHMNGVRRRLDVREPLPTGACGASCAAHPEGCAWARRALLDPHVLAACRTTVYTTLEAPAVVMTVWQDVVAAVRPTFPSHLSVPDSMQSLARHAADWFIGRDGRTAGWTYAVTGTLTAALGDVLAAVAVGDERSASNGEPIIEELTARMLTRDGDPLPSCTTVCGAAPGPCRFRHPVRAVLDPDTQHYWPAKLDDSTAESAFRLAQDMADTLIDAYAGTADRLATERLSAAHRRATFCYAQHAMHGSGQRPAFIRANLLRLRAAEDRIQPSSPDEVDGPGHHEAAANP